MSLHFPLWQHKSLSPHFEPKDVHTTHFPFWQDRLGKGSQHLPCFPPHLPPSIAQSVGDMGSPGPVSEVFKSQSSKPPSSPLPPLPPLPPLYTFIFPVEGSNPNIRSNILTIKVIKINGINTINHDIMPKPRSHNKFNNTVKIAVTHIFKNAVLYEPLMVSITICVNEKIK